MYRSQCAWLLCIQPEFDPNTDIEFPGATVSDPAHRVGNDSHALPDVAPKARKL